MLSRSAETEVLIENGDTAVIGGIYIVDKNMTESGVPWLSKIPILGMLFRRKSWRDSRVELLIFLTPRIINTNKAFSKTRLEG